MSALVGTGGLIRLILRRDRFILPLWIFWLAIVPAAGIAAFADLYPTAVARQAFAQLAGANPALTALYGKLYGSSIGALVAWRYSVVAAFAGLASFLTVIRHTRTEEEAGRRELLGSTVVGRSASLTAALVVVFGANLVLAAVIAGSLIGQDQPVAGSIALGVAYAAGGFVFAAIGGFAAQLTQNAGSARGIAGAALGLSFLVRAVGDAGDISWLTWVSPLGWSTLLRPFAGERWWVLVPVAGAVIVFSAAGFALLAKRDVGAGIFAARLGPATTAGLRSAFALAWRLQRTLLVAWGIGIGLYALLIGGIADSFADMLRDNPQLEQYFAAVGGKAGLTDLAIASLVNIMALIISGYAIQCVLRLRREEVVGRAQPVLATTVGRIRYAIGHLIFAVAGPAAVMAAAGVLIGLTYGSITGDVGRQIWRMLGVAVVQLPAVWILAGLAMALYGLAPRFAAPGAWGAMAAFFIVMLFGEIFQLPEWAINISPFTHIPKLPGGEFTLAPVIWMLAIAAALIAVGLAGFRRRDIA